MKLESDEAVKMNNSNRRGVRKYQKSEQPRLRWTPELHQYFVETVESIGGKNKATPKHILSMMPVKGLKISHIKSHLQMYRSTKGHTIVKPMHGHLVEENAHFKDLPFSTSCSPQRSENINEELQPLHNRGSQTSKTDLYDLNQEPESSECFHSDMSNEEENNRTTKFIDLPFSFTTQLIPMVHSDKDRMHFSSPTTTNHHVVHSTSLQSHGSSNINLDLRI